MAATMKLSGFKELEAELKTLGSNATSRRVAERALNRAAAPIVVEAKRLAPDDPATGMGNYLVESIKVGRARAKQHRAANTGQSVVVFIGIDGSVKKPRNSKTKKTRRGDAKQSGGGVAAYSIFTEMGTVTHKAQPYMRPAFEAKQKEAMDGVVDILREEITKTKGRAARKAARQAAKG